MGSVVLHISSQGSTNSSAGKFVIKKCYINVINMLLNIKKTVTIYFSLTKMLPQNRLHKIMTLVCVYCQIFPSLTKTMLPVDCREDQRMYSTKMISVFLQLHFS